MYIACILFKDGTEAKLTNVETISYGYAEDNKSYPIEQLDLHPQLPENSSICIYSNEKKDIAILASDEIRAIHFYTR